MQAEESKDQDTQEGHILRCPGGTGDFSGFVVAALGQAIGPREQDPLDGMEQDAGIQANGDDLDDRVVRHEGGVDIERSSAVIRQELEIAGHVDDEEEDQEDAGEAHDDLLSQGGGQETG